MPTTITARAAAAGFGGSHNNNSSSENICCAAFMRWNKFKNLQMFIYTYIRKSVLVCICMCLCIHERACVKCAHAYKLHSFHQYHQQLQRHNQLQSNWQLRRWVALLKLADASARRLVTMAVWLVSHDHHDLVSPNVSQMVTLAHDMVFNVTANWQ